MAKFIQPRIVSEFKCDGSICPSNCCKYGWKIDLDADIVQKYREMGIDCAYWDNELQKYCMRLLPNGSCSLLREDGWCSIHKRFGESFLSTTCRRYPRYIQSFDEKIFTRSFTLTCPIAADLFLRQNDPLEFIQVEDEIPTISNISLQDVSDEQCESIINVNLASIRILQNRRMTIDQRLLTLGFFIAEVGDFRENPDLFRDNLKMLDELCASERFIKTELPKFCRAIKFDAEDFIRIMFSLLESMYGKNSDYGAGGEFFDLIQSTGTLYMDDDNTTSISKSAKKYLKLKSVREKFFKHASIVIENSLVNEFWIQCFPYRFMNISTIQNYFFFVIMYKLQEFLLTSYLEIQRHKSHSLNKSKVEDAAIHSAKMFSMIFEHSPKLVQKISGIAKSKGDDLRANLSSMLQV